MYLKRPSFRRGGSTGIGQLSSNRQMYAGGGNIGGGIIAGSNLGSRTGFNELSLIGGGMQNELTGGQQVGQGTKKPDIKTSKLQKAKNILQRGTSIFKNPTPGSSNPFFINQLKNIYSKIPKTSGIFNVLRTGASAAPVASTLAIPAATTFGLMQMNKAKTIEALEYMKSMNQSGVFDETAGPEDFEEYTKVFNYLNENGTPISFTENFASDEKIKQIKEEGRTPIVGGEADVIEDFEVSGEALPGTEGKNIDALSRILEEGTILKEKKKEEDVDIDGTDKPEPTFEDIYETEKKRIEKLIGDDSDKGMAAIALSEAIGTPGTIADKAAVLNKSLAQIMAGKKKDKKDIAKLAYTATKEIEKAKIAAGKEGFSEKNFKKMVELQKIISDTTGRYSEAQKKAAQAEYDVAEKVIGSIGGKKTEGSLTGFNQAGELVSKLNKLAKTINKLEKGSTKYNEKLQEYFALRNFASGFKNEGLNAGIATVDAILKAAGNFPGAKDGGRIGFAQGTSMEESVQVSETVGQGETPTAQVQKLSYDELRNRLPKEITDDVIRLIANSNEALQDFAYIRTQGDVVKFNTKYGVNLVLPAQTA